MKHFKYLGFLFAVSFFFQFPIQYLVNESFLNIEDNYRNFSLGLDLKSFQVFYYLVVFFPLFEELSFRLFLNPTNRNIKFGLAFLLVIVAYKIINQNFSIESHKLLVTLGSFCFAILLGFYFLEKFTSLSRKIASINQKCILYLSSIIFALMHFETNYSSHIFIISLFPLVKHFISGMIYGTFRIKYGFINGVFLHVLNNSLTFLVMFFN